MLAHEEYKVDLTKKNDSNNEEIREFESLEEPEKDEIKEKVENWGKNPTIDLQETNQIKEIDLEKELDQHKLELERIKLDGQKEREKREIYNKEQLENIKAEMKLKEAIREQKAQFPHPVTSRVWGMIFILTAILGTIASTVITLCSGWEVYKAQEMTKFAFLSAIVIIQGSIFIFNCMRTKILTQFPTYAMIFHIITKSLLLVSIYFNFLFFRVQYDGDILQQVVILLSCIMLDFIAVYSTSLGMDLFTLNMYARSQTKGLVEMVWFNMTSKFRNRQLEKYNENVLDYNEIAKKKGKSKHKEYLNEKSDDVKVEVLDEEDNIDNEVEDEEPKETPKPIDVFVKFTKKDRDNYLRYIIKNANEKGLIPTNRNVLKACENKKTINLNKAKINSIREELYNCNVLKRPNKGTHPTYFTKEFIEILENWDGKKLPEISEKYIRLDKENDNYLNPRNEENQDKIDEIDDKNSEEKLEENQDKIDEINDKNLEEKLEENQDKIDEKNNEKKIS